MLIPNSLNNLPRQKLCKIWVCSVCPLPRKNSEQTEEDNDSKLKDILNTINLIVLIGMFGNLATKISDILWQWKLNYVFY
jgi:hypothetical protein